MRRILFFLIYASLCCGVGIALHQQKQQMNMQKVLSTYQMPAFGTLLTFYLPPTKEADLALKEIISLCQEIHKTINVYSKDSEVSRLNHQAHEQPFYCSPLLWEIITASRLAWQETDGYFDITIGPLMSLWGFRKTQRVLERVPSEVEIQLTLSFVGLDKIQFDDEKHTIFFIAPKMRVDFGGIAKGFALKKSAEILHKHHISEGMLNFGGNILALDNPIDKDKLFTIGIQDPSHLEDTKHVLGCLKMRQQAIATSGSYENKVKIRGKNYSHIINPKTGWPIEDKVSVSIVCQDPLDSDVFSTAVFVGDDPVFLKLKSRDPQAQVYIQK